MRNLSLVALALCGLGCFDMTGCTLGPQDQAAIASAQAEYQAALADAQRLVADATTAKDAAEAKAAELQAAYEKIAQGGLGAEDLATAVSQIASLQAEAMDMQQRWQEAQAAASSAWSHVQAANETVTAASAQTGTPAWILALLGAAGPVSAAVGQMFNTWYRGIPNKGAGARKRARTIAEGPPRTQGPPTPAPAVV